MQTKSRTSVVGGNVSIRVSLGDQFLTASVNKKTNKVRSAVVTTVIMYSLGDVCLVEIDLEVHILAIKAERLLMTLILTSAISSPSKSLSALATQVPSGAKMRPQPL